MKIAIIGSRKLNISVQEMYNLVKSFEIEMIISGGAFGIDSTAKKMAELYDIPYKEYLPEYGKYGKGATFIRNRLIVEAADLVIAFWDGSSRGTKYTLNYAGKIGKETKVYNFTKQLSLF